MGFFSIGVVVGFCCCLFISLTQNSFKESIYRLNEWLFKKTMPKYRIIHNGYYYLLQRKLGFLGWKNQTKSFSKKYTSKQSAEKDLQLIIKDDKISRANFKEVIAVSQTDLYKTLTKDKMEDTN